jgi:hypothetical protein
MQGLRQSRESKHICEGGTYTKVLFCISDQKRYTDFPKGIFSLGTPEQSPKAPENPPLKSRVQELRGKVEQLASTIRREVGEDDLRTVRAGEVSDALQRLEWAISRLL